MSLTHNVINTRMRSFLKHKILMITSLSTYSISWPHSEYCSRLSSAAIFSSSCSCMITENKNITLNFLLSKALSLIILIWVCYGFDSYVCSHFFIIIFFLICPEHKRGCAAVPLISGDLFKANKKKHTPWFRKWSKRKQHGCVHFCSSVGV